MNEPTIQQQKPKRLPYGMQNWEDVRLHDYYYVDKTRFIPLIEEANHYFFFIRPRRFGKSLLMNMLRQYYDVNKRALFDRLFGDLWIGSHPTEMHNQYMVLYLNFAMISGGLKDYERSMNSYCRTQMEFFCRVYEELLPKGALDGLGKKETARDMLDYVSTMAHQTNQKIYLFIDEYDHFTNEILSDPGTEHGYKGEAHGSGAMRAFFNVVKGGTDSAIKRCFITGVSPVTMDDLTSGFNIGTNYTTQPEFNAMVGFTEEEVRQMLDYYRQFYTFRHTTDELIELMRPWYDNYRFSLTPGPSPMGEGSIYLQAQEQAAELITPLSNRRGAGGAASTMFNSDMVLYFVYFYTKDGGRFPKNMLDSNIRTDYSKLRMLIRKDRGFEHDASIIQHIVETGGITAELKEHFPSEGITDPDNFVSLLYYFGMLTISGTRRGKIVFRIPNQTVREQLYGYLIDTYRENHLDISDYERGNLMEAMAYDGDWRPFFDHIAETLRRFASNRDKQKGEAFVHGFTLAQTCLSRCYLPVSELDAGAKTVIGGTTTGGYADIYLQPLLNIYPDLEHSYVLELKYLPARATDAEVAAAATQARGQLLRYAQSVAVERTYAPTRLHKLVLLWRGMELAVAEELHSQNNSCDAMTEPRLY